MKRKALFLLCFNMSLITHFFAQTSVNWSESYMIDHISKNYKQILANEKYIYFFSHPVGSGDHYYIDVFDAASIKFLNREEIYPEFSKLKGKYGGIIMMKDKLLCFRSEYDGKLKGYNLYAKKISLEGDVDKSEFKIALIEGDEKTTSFSYQTNLDFDNFLLVENTKMKDGKKKATVTLLDLDLKQIWKKTIPIDIDNQRFKVKNYYVERAKVTKDGNVYVMIGFEKENDKNQPKYFYNLYYFNPITEVIKEMLIDMDENYINPSFIINNNAGLIVMGTYSERKPKIRGKKEPINKKDYSSAGIFYYNVNTKKNELGLKHLHPFGSEFLNAFDNSDLTKDNKEVYGLTFDHLCISDDTSGIIIGQQYCNIGSGIQTSNQVHCHTDNIFVVKINSNGSLAWEKMIRKSQHGTDGTIPLASYGFFYNKKSCYFLFNDNKANAMLSLEQVYDKKSFTGLGSFGKSNCTLVKLDFQGNEERKTLFENDDRVSIYSPSISYHKDNSRVAIIYSTNTHNYLKLGKLLLK